ncbi:protein IQ-DOMAIN 5-like isoform X2 [Salvia splendens]|uniref:protein IQ-DOMAIN 5-like isoform X2 n=1 Tax=Salvia splendens TaxID=180675 RepID=UPI001C27417B|nr:protein IQ-DOMAIN 5-like isoform X2 [Salvia splendens]
MMSWRLIVESHLVFDGLIKYHTPTTSPSLLLLCQLLITQISDLKVHALFSSLASSEMGCFKNIFSLNRPKLNGRRSKHSIREGSILANGDSWKKRDNFRQLTRESAATRIQTAFRAYKARKALRGIKGIDRFKGVVRGHFCVGNQAVSALNHIHFWSRIQGEIRARWLGMVVESRARQKKLDNQLKLDAKLHELEVEWSSSPETMDDILNRIQQREAASAKRERTMAYAFSHQWRANTNQYFGQSYYDLSKESWGWSWKERWVAVRPWEKPCQTSPSPIKKAETKQKTGEVKAAFPHARKSSKVSQEEA